MGKLFAPIIDRSITAFIGSSCSVKIYQQEDSEGTGVIYKYQDEYKYTTSSSLSINTTTDFILQAWEVNNSSFSKDTSSSDLSTWLNDTSNRENYSKPSDAIRFFHITDETNFSYRYDEKNNILTISIDFDFQNSDELIEYQIQVKKVKENESSTSFTYADSGILFPSENNAQEIVQLPVSSKVIGNSCVYVWYRTKKGYSATKQKNISNNSVFQNIETLLFSFTPNENEVIITIANESDIPISGYLYRRWQNEKGLWQELPLRQNRQTISVGETVTFKDYAIEYNKTYTYYFRDMIDRTEGGASYIMNDNGNMYLQSYTLSNNKNIQIDKSLCIKFNPKVEGLKRNLSDSIINTLDAQYPYIARSGRMNYRTFTLGGLISIEAEGDLNNLSSYSILTSNQIEAIKEHNSGTYEDRVIQEKIYRDAVLAWLYQPGIKRFSSGPEGVIYVYLSNISLSSDPVTSRNWYSFSCQATEVTNPEAEGYTLINN